MKFTPIEVKEITLSQLNPEEILVLRLLANVDPVDAAKALGSSTQYVYQIRNTALVKLRLQGYIPVEEMA